MTDLVEVVVGTVGRAHGIRGDVGIDVRTDEPDRRFADGVQLGIEGTGRTLTVASSKWHSGRLLVRFAEAADRNDAEALRGSVLVVQVSPDELPTDDEEYYDRQLVGLRAENATGAVLGTVTAVVHLPAQDLLAIDVDGAERLVPFVQALVPVVDLPGGRVVVTELPGLLDEDADIAAPEQP